MKHKISEAEWQRDVIKLAQLFGWRCAHFRPGLNQRGKWMTAVAGNGVGFPDLVLVHEQTGDLLFAELKADTGKLRPEQEEWMRAIQAGGSRRFVVWRPKDLEEVRARLMAHREAA